MNNLITLIKKEFLEQKKTYKLMILFILFIFFAILSPITAKLLPQIIKNYQTSGITFNVPEPTTKDAIDQFVKNISSLIVFVLVFMLAGAIADEKAKKTLEMMLAKPIKRKDFILSKFLAYGITIKAAFIASAAVFYFYTISLFHSLDLLRFVILCALLLIYILFISSITLFGSAIAKSTIAAAAIGFSGMIIFSTIVGYIKAISKYSPNYIISHYTDLMTNGWDPKFLPSAITSIVLIVLLVMLSTMLFKRQEIER